MYVQACRVNYMSYSNNKWYNLIQHSVSLSARVELAPLRAPYPALRATFPPVGARKGFPYHPFRLSYRAVPRYGETDYRLFLFIIISHINHAHHRFRQSSAYFTRTIFFVIDCAPDVSRAI